MCQKLVLSMVFVVIAIWLVVELFVGHYLTTCRFRTTYRHPVSISIHSVYEYLKSGHRPLFKLKFPPGRGC